MCGEIVIESTSKKSPIVLGEFLPAEAKVFIQKEKFSLEAISVPGQLVRWSGFAREETINEKFSTYSRGEIIIDGFNEKGRDYTLPKGYSVQAMFLKTGDVYQANIITRPGEEKELSVSERFPKTGKRRFTCSENNSGGGNPEIKTNDQLRVGVTGHRPKDVLKEDVYNWKNPKAVEIRAWLTQQLTNLKEQAEKENKEIIAVSGMALGVDLWFAACCVNLNIPFIALLPCRNQDKMWGDEYRKIYDKAVSRAVEVRYTADEDYPGSWVMLQRNTDMAHYLAGKEGSVLLSVHNGKNGGTAHMRGQARKYRVTNINYNPETGETK